MTARPLTAPFTALGRRDIALVGGKGANLGELTRAGFPVPDGFCVTTHAYHAFISSFSAELHAPLTSLDPSNIDALRQLGARTRALMRAHDLPDELIEELTHLWSARSPETRYAVRSSATAEDLPDASFAGQQDTYLNIIGLEPLLEHVKACFISLFTDRAILYRVQNGFPHEQVALSVVVQKMVLPATSGIAFTADPITEHRHVISIDAGLGLGEALVSGLVSADLYKVDKRSMQITSTQIAHKALMIEPLPEGGTREVELSAEVGGAPALTDRQILELARVCAEIERHYGAPQDIEWCFEDDTLYITQARPITTLYPLADDHTRDDLKVFISLSHLQVMTDPMPNMSISLWRNIPKVGLDERGEFAYAKDVGGRAYADFTPILSHPLGRRAVSGFLTVADDLTRAAVLEIIARPEFARRTKRARLWPLLSLARHVAPRVIANLLFARTDDAVEQANQIIADYTREVRETLATPALSTTARIDAGIEALRGVIPAALGWIPRFAAGALAQRLLHRIARSSPELITSIERGIEGNVVTEMNLAMGDLADLARGEPAIVAALTSSAREGTWRERLDAAPNSAPFIDALDTFLARFGSRGPSEIDVSRPRWSEDPTSLFQMIASMARGQTHGAHREHYQHLVEEGRRAAALLPEQVSWLLRPLTRRLIRVSRDLMPLREHHKSFLVAVLAEVKKTLVSGGAELARANALEHREDVWFLEVTELKRALGGAQDDLRALVARRRARHASNARKTPPRVITSDGEIVRPRLERDAAPDGALIGSPVSAGVYEGIARVVKDPGVESLEPGEVLIASFTDPGWTPLFLNAAALVTEVGGLMTHGSVVAREYGIPAVVAVEDATRSIQTGDRVRVNGDEGFVEILTAEVSE